MDGDKEFLLVHMQGTRLKSVLTLPRVYTRKGGGGGVNVTISCSEFSDCRGNLAETAVCQG